MCRIGMSGGFISTSELKLNFPRKELLMKAAKNWYFLKFPVSVIDQGIWAQLVGAEQAVLVVLCKHADHSGTCWPSVARLVKWTGYTRRAVQMALDGLEALGVIKRRGRRTGERTWVFEIPGLRPPETGNV